MSVNEGESIKREYLVHFFFVLLFVVHTDFDIYHLHAVNTHKIVNRVRVSSRSALPPTPRQARRCGITDSTIETGLGRISFLFSMRRNK